MLVIPAIDLLEGHCVRLYQGNFDQSTQYSNDPVEMALHWEAAGAEWLHIVDLNGARQGEPQHLDVLGRIRAASNLSIEFGGGLRSMLSIDAALEHSDRAVIGTAAVRDPDMVKSAVGRYGDRIAVGIDARNGQVAVEGWKSSTEQPASAVAQRMRDLGVTTIIFTDIEMDGTLKGPNLEALRSLQAIEGIHLIASGGIASIAHLRQLARLGIEGCIVGKALYEGTIDLGRALHEVEEPAERYEW